MPHLSLAQLPLKAAQPLPTLDQVDKLDKKAWSMVLAAEADPTLKDKTHNVARKDNLLIGARVSGSTLYVFYEWQEQFGSLGPYNSVREDILACGSDDSDAADVNEKVQVLGLRYYNTLFRTFYVVMSNPGPTPAPSEHPSRPDEFEVHRQSIIDRVNELSKTKRHVKEEALLRDGFKCVISGVYDSWSIEAYTEVSNAWERDGCPRHTITQAAHLFSQTPQEGPSGFDALAHRKMFGLGDSVEAILTGQVNRLENVLNTEFDRGMFWLEEDPTL